MVEPNTESFCLPAASVGSPVGDLLTATLREGAQKMLATTIAEEVAAYLAARSHCKDPTDLYNTHDSSSWVFFN